LISEDVSNKYMSARYYFISTVYIKRKNENFNQLEFIKYISINKYIYKILIKLIDINIIIFNKINNLIS